jgi:transposase
MRQTVPISIEFLNGGKGRDYFQRRLAEGDDRRRALRSLKRRLARVVFTRLHADHRDSTRDARSQLPNTKSFRRQSGPTQASSMRPVRSRTAVSRASPRHRLGTPKGPVSSR